MVRRESERLCTNEFSDRRFGQVRLVLLEEWARIRNDLNIARPHGDDAGDEPGGKDNQSAVEHPRHRARSGREVTCVVDDEAKGHPGRGEDRSRLSIEPIEFVELNLEPSLNLLEEQAPLLERSVWRRGFDHDREYISGPRLLEQTF